MKIHFRTRTRSVGFESRALRAQKRQKERVGGASQMQRSKKRGAGSVSLTLDDGSQSCSLAFLRKKAWLHLLSAALSAVWFWSSALYTSFACFSIVKSFRAAFLAPIQQIACSCSFLLRNLSAHRSLTHTLFHLYHLRLREIGQPRSLVYPGRRVYRAFSHLNRHLTRGASF